MSEDLRDRIKRSRRERRDRIERHHRGDVDDGSEPPRGSGIGITNLVLLGPNILRIGGTIARLKWVMWKLARKRKKAVKIFRRELATHDLSAHEVDRLGELFETAITLE